MIVGRTFCKLARIATIAVAVLPSLVQAFIPSVPDRLSSIRALVDATSGETVAEYEYDPYGVLLEEAGEKAGKIKGQTSKNGTEWLFFLKCGTFCRNFRLVLKQSGIPNWPRLPLSFRHERGPDIS